MSRRYTEGARALLIIGFTFLSLTSCMLGFLIIESLDPSPKTIKYSFPEFIPVELEKSFECQFDRAVQIIFVDDLVEWLTTSDGHAYCLRRKSPGQWIIYVLDEMKTTAD